MSLENPRIRFPRLCTIPTECTLAMREVDIALGWELVGFSPTKPSQQPSISAPLEGDADHSQWLDRIQQGAVREYRPVLPGSVCRYVPPPVPVARVVPTCVVGEPEDWEREYADTQVSAVASQVDPQPFRLRGYRTGRRVGVLASSIRGMHTLSLQHFTVRNPMPATDDATRIGSDGYLMSLRRDAMVVVVPRDQWDRLC